jgi:tRNA A-37 threonylcarbamoyl transferase component Bud32
MLSFTRLATSQVLRTTLRAPQRTVAVHLSVRSISNETKEVFTNIADESDPNRDAIFQYTWGTWLKNDEAQKRKRFTRFSLTGLQSVLKDLYQEGRANTDEHPSIVPPKTHDKNFVSLPHNLTVKNTGSLNPNENLHIKQLVSIHEGKHHRVYKVETNAGSNFVLRVPYPLDTEYAISKRIQSEVATMDFADLKLGIKVPKVFAYGADNSNPVGSPFVLMEFIEGETLMRKWAPMTPRTDPKQKEIIGLVVDPLSEFQAKLADIEFNEFGSLYFTVDAKDRAGLKEPYEGEAEETLKGRYFIGPSTERVFWRGKHLLRKNQFEPLVGPWAADKPLDIVKSVAAIELENARTKLALVEADATGVSESKEELKQQIETFTNLASIAPVLMDVHSPSVKNIDALFRPRLAHTDIDPLNVLVNGEEHTFLDFEGATIKPIIFQSTPRFVAYEDGPKVYEFEIDEEKYSAMEESDKYYYDFAVARTRNEVTWDLGLGKTFTKLGTEGSPVLKRLRGPLLEAVERRTAKETALVDRKIYELALQWAQFAEHKFVTVAEFPVAIDAEKFERHTKELEKYYEELTTVPFAVTGGWVPQDLFDSLKSQGVIKKLDNGDYEVVQEAAQEAQA